VHIIITDAWLARRQALHLNGWKLIAAAAMAVLGLMFSAVATYHWVFLEGIRQGWPGFASVARLVHPDNPGERDAYLRANLDAMARKLGEMQARMMQIDSLGERVAGLAGSARPLVVAELLHAHPRPAVVVVKTMVDAHRWAQDLRFFGAPVLEFPEREPRFWRGGHHREADA